MGEMDIVGVLVVNTPGTSREVIDNRSEDHSFQINAPIKEGAWDRIDRVKISGNAAKNASAQLNYPVSEADYKWTFGKFKFQE
jgi:hypothetical protein